MVIVLFRYSVLFIAYFIPCVSLQARVRVARAPSSNRCASFMARVTPTRTSAATPSSSTRTFSPPCRPWSVPWTTLRSCTNTSRTRCGLGHTVPQSKADHLLKKPPNVISVRWRKSISHSGASVSEFISLSLICDKHTVWHTFRWRISFIKWSGKKTPICLIIEI